MSCRALERPEQLDNQGMNYVFPASAKEPHMVASPQLDMKGYAEWSKPVLNNGCGSYFNPHDRKQKTAIPPESIVSSSGENTTTYKLTTNSHGSSMNTSYADLDAAFGKSEELEQFENKMGDGLYVTPKQISNDLDNVNAKLEEISRDYVKEQTESKIRTYPKQIPPQTIYQTDPYPLWNRPYFRQLGSSELLEHYGSSTFSDTLEYYTGMDLYKWGLLIILLILLFVVIYCVSSNNEAPITASLGSQDAIRKNLLSLQNQIRRLVSN